MLIPVQKIANENGRFTLFSIKDNPKYNYQIVAESTTGRGMYTLKFTACLALAKERLYDHASYPTEEELYGSMY